MSAIVRPLSCKWLRWLVGGAIVLMAWALLFARTVDRDLNHDEHQLLAPAALLSEEGLQPWRDYALFHLPNLVFAYAAADHLTGDLILGAKLVSFAGSAAVILGLVVVAMNTRRLGVSLLLSAAAVGLLLSDPLFRYTTGKTWNHEVPTALLLAAIAAIAGAAKGDRLWLSALAGGCAGLATGCRLTFAPTLVGLFAFTWLMSMPLRRRAIHAAVLTATATLALSPSFYYLVTQTEAFIFCNFEFPRLRLLDPTDTRAQETVVWWRKFRFFFKEVIRESWGSFVLWAVLSAPAGWLWLRRKDKGDLTSAVILIVIPFALFGCFAPSRYQYQHYYVFVPLLVYGVVVGIRSVSSEYQILTVLLAMLLAATSGFQSRNDFANIRNLNHSEEWFSTKAADVGKRISAEVGDRSGRILTLAPAIALAGKLPVYPELATGAFGWRGASGVDKARRNRLHLLVPEDLEDTMSRQIPAAVLTGVEEPEEEEALVVWAQKNNYRPVDLRKKRVIWLSPRQ